MNLDTETQYLTDIKFRNAVKRATALKVFNKSDYGYRFGVSINEARTVDKTIQGTVFTVSYFGGDRENENSLRILMKNRIRLVQDLAIAGFDIVEVEVYKTFGTGTETIRAYRKAA